MSFNGITWGPATTNTFTIGSTIGASNTTATTGIISVTSDSTLQFTTNNTLQWVFSDDQKVARETLNKLEISTNPTELLAL